MPAHQSRIKLIAVCLLDIEFCERTRVYRTAVLMFLILSWWSNNSRETSRIPSTRQAKLVPGLTTSLEPGVVTSPLGRSACLATRKRRGCCAGNIHQLDLIRSTTSCGYRAFTVFAMSLMSRLFYGRHLSVYRCQSSIHRTRRAHETCCHCCVRLADARRQ
jgi:hypothetical protein